jgi:serine/threonine protein kinase/WD40 repeat protein
MLNAGLVPHVPDPASSFSPGSKTDLHHFGDYELLEEIAHGGMGVVYRARQISLKRTVAVKMLLLGQFSSEQSIQRFRREANAVASLQHPNIVAVHEVGAVEGQPFFSMDFIEGRSLASIIRENPLPARTTAQYCHSIAEAIAYAHTRGVIHRDLKPSNILIDIFDQVRITDFGLAKQLDDRSELTLTGHLLGSPNYLPPEVASGKQREATVLGDIYSIGAMLYECLTGRPPFLAESVQETLLKIRDTETPAPRILQPRVPRDLETICLKCLEKEPQKRYGEAHELANDLDRFLDNEPIHARSVGPIGKSWRWCRRKPALAASLSLILILLLIVIIGSPIALYRINTALHRAEAGELNARQNQYAADMNDAYQSILGGDLFRAVQLLRRNRPENKSDLRGWEWRYLWQQAQGEPDTILGFHTNGVTAAGFLPGGKTAFSAGKDNSVRFWDLASKKQTGFLPHESRVTGCAASPDGRWMATTSETLADSPGPLRLWDLQSRQSEILTTNFWLRPNSTIFSPDSKLLAFVNLETGVKLWNVGTRLPITNMPAYFHFTGTLGIAFSPDSRTLAYSENEQGDIVLWDIASQSPRERLKGHKLFINSLAFTPDGQTVLSSSMDKTVKLWSLADGPQHGTFTDFNAKAEYLRLSRDGTTLAILSGDRPQVISLHDLRTGVRIRELMGHEDSLSDGAFSPDGRSFITASQDGTVRLWPVRSDAEKKDTRPYSGTVAQLCDGTGTALCPSPDGRKLLVVHADKSFTLWDTASLTEGARFPLPITGFQCAALASGAKTAAFIGHGGKVLLWHADSENVEEFSLPIKEDSARACFSADGQRLAIGGWRDVWVFATATGRLIRQLHFRDEGTAPGDNVMCLSFSTDGQKLMAGFYYGPVRVWDLTQQNRDLIFDGGDHQIRGVTISPDGQTIYAVGAHVLAWDLSSQRLIFSFRPRQLTYHGCSISPDGRRLAVGAGDGMITIWDLASRREVITLKGHARSIDDLFFLGDGNTLVSIGLDEVRVWRASSLSENGRSTVVRF